MSATMERPYKKKGMRWHRPPRRGEQYQGRKSENAERIVEVIGLIPDPRRPGEKLVKYRVLAGRYVGSVQFYRLRWWHQAYKASP